MPWKIIYPHGLHARPASRWAEIAGRIGGNINVSYGLTTANAKRVSELLQLGAINGETVLISASGHDAQKHVKSFIAQVSSTALEDQAETSSIFQPQPESPSMPWADSALPGVLRGIAASPGIAVAQCDVLIDINRTVSDESQGVWQEAHRLQMAIDNAQHDLRKLLTNTQIRIGLYEAEIFKAQIAMLSDEGLLVSAAKKISEGHSAAWSWHRAMEDLLLDLTAGKNNPNVSRAADYKDVRNRVLAHISVVDKGKASELEGPVIVVAEDISPSAVATMDTRRICGLVTEQGSAQSHVAILARSLRLPAVIGVADVLMQITVGQQIIIDGNRGVVHISPTVRDIRDANDAITALAAKNLQLRDSLPPSRVLTADGHQIAILANADSPQQAEKAIESGAEGVGLMRTEFLFMSKNRAPTEDEQFEVYSSMARAVGNRQLVIRVLDAGGDKRLDYLQPAFEQNPFLGIRGSRLLLRHPEILQQQLRAIFRVAREGAKPSVLFPMITFISEVDELQHHCEVVRRSLNAPAIPIGIMVEVPAVVANPEAFVQRADFLSIGTNDLTQYMLAIDRQNTNLAKQSDGLDPSVLRMLMRVLDCARKARKEISVCGEMAGEPLSACLLVGLGVRTLSMSAGSMPEVQSILARQSMEDLENIGKRALTCESIEQVQCLLGELH